MQASGRCSPRPEDDRRTLKLWKRVYLKAFKSENAFVWMCLRALLYSRDWWKDVWRCMLPNLTTTEGTEVTFPRKDVTWRDISWGFECHWSFYKTVQVINVILLGFSCPYPVYTYRTPAVFSCIDYVLRRPVWFVILTVDHMMFFLLFGCGFVGGEWNKTICIWQFAMLFYGFVQRVLIVHLKFRDIF